MWIDDCEEYNTEESKNTAENYRNLQRLYVWYKNIRPIHQNNLDKELIVINTEMTKKYGERFFIDILEGNDRHINNDDLKKWQEALKQFSDAEIEFDKTDKKKLELLISCWSEMDGL